MALQGTIETFALPEVLRLLGSGAKTGRLRVSGDRGSGSVWIDGGKVVGAEATGTRQGASAVSVVFELLRYVDGSFTFDDDQTDTEPGTPQDIEVLLADAERHLSEWQEIEAVVPSLAVGLTLAAELPGEDVVVDTKRWKALVAVADGRSVQAMADALELDEFEACRRAKELVEAGLVETTELVLADPAPAPVPSPEVATPVEGLVPSSAAAEVQLDADVDAGAGDGDGDGGFELVNGSAPVLVDEAASVGAFELADSDSTPPEPGLWGAAPEQAEDAGSAGGAGFGTEMPVDTRSSARAELDAMASGFGLQDEASTYGELPAEPPTSTDGSFSSGDFAAGGDFGDSAFDAGFASDPTEDPAFSFAAPGAGDDGFGSFGSSGGPTEPAEPTGATSGAALFADDVVSAAPPASGLNGSDGLFAPGTSGFDGPDESGDAAEVARQLANLSPKAARAVAAAARASTDEEREAALAEVTADGDEPINRGLLLKFLSSVQT